MMKFESDDWSLEICEFARPSKIFIYIGIIIFFIQYSIV